MSRINDVLTAFGQNVSSAINTYSGITTPSQTIVGWPNFEDLTKIIQQGQYLVSIFDTGKTRDTSRFYPQWMKLSDPNVTLTASISGNVITFAGTVPSSGSQFNVHTLVGAPLQDTLVQTVAGDTPSTVATKVKNAIVAAGIPGVSATVSGTSVTVTGSPNIKCNIGGSATLAREVARHKRTIQVSMWCPNPQIRASVGDAISANVGVKGLSTKFITLPDGTNVWAEWYSSADVDDKQADYSVFIRHLFFNLEYGVLQYQQATQIGAIQETWQVQGVTLPSITEG